MRGLDLTADTALAFLMTEEAAPADNLGDLRSFSGKNEVSQLRFAVSVERIKEKGHW